MSAKLAGVDDLAWASAVEQRRLLEEGEVSAAELHEVAVDAIERLDPVIHAVVAPLFDRRPAGVPMLLKDAGQELAGTSHWVGVAALRDAAATSTTTTELAARFEAYGFSVVGKAACPQLSTGITTEPTGFEPTRNPWDLDRSAGGSSGGPAAAVASGMVAVAHGSDGTGSLRCPAALCGVATLNPTAGRIPSTPPAGQPPNEAWRDFVLARHAEDLTAVFMALAGPLASSRTESTTWRRWRVGLLDHDPELGMAVDPACVEGVHVVGRLLEAHGLSVEVAWPGALDRLWSAIFSAFGVVSDAARPAVLRWVSDRLGRPVASGEVDDSVFEAVARAAGRDDAAVNAAEARITAATVPVTSWWDDHDLLVTPTTFQPAWPLGGSPGPAEMGSLLAPFSLTGQPSLSLPLHRTGDGLPVGVQLVGRHGADEALLALAEALQSASDWTVRRPPR